MYTNYYGEKFNINSSNYSILSTDSKPYDMVINPFDLNTSKNYPYEDEGKNKSCFLEIETEFENILLIFKTDVEPSLAELYEPYYNQYTDGYDVSYNFDLMNNDKQLVVMYGTSIMMLDINNFNVLKFISSDKIKDYGINLFNKDNYYIVEDYYHNFIFFDNNLNEIVDNNDIIKKMKIELIEESKKKYGISYL